MRVLLIHLDGKLPNLALMITSTHHKMKGDQVGFHTSNPDLVYVSCVFEENLSQAKGISTIYPNAQVLIGGPGLGEFNTLPFNTTIMPDYSLYPDMDYSLGFTTRGCIRNCPFCMVPKLEGSFREHAHPNVFHNPEFNKIVLFDNNLLASDSWLETCQWIQDQGLKVSFNQGLDARLIDEKKAKILADMKAYNLHFNSRTFYFSWDLMEAEKGVFKGLHKMIDAGVNPRSLMIYMLVGFNTTHNQDYYRFKKLVELGCDPFVMIYNNRRDDSWIRHFARWVNRRRYKVCDLVDYNRLPKSLKAETEIIIHTSLRKVSDNV